MSSARAPPPAPLKVPKLNYRNTSSRSTTDRSTSQEDSRFTVPQSSPSPSHTPTSTPSLTSSSRPSFISAPSQSSDFSFLRPTTSKPAKAKKKASSIFGSFFRTKEPSAQAFAEYHKEAARRAAAQCKDGRTPPTAVISGVSNAKLPATVPKVNTRWDGIPKALKEREKERETSHRRSLHADTTLSGLAALRGDVQDKSNSSIVSGSSLTRSQSPGSSNGSSWNRNVADEMLTKPNTSAPSFSSAAPAATHLHPRSVPSAAQSLRSSSTTSLPDFASALSANTAAGGSAVIGLAAFRPPAVVTPTDSPWHDTHPIIVPSPSDSHAPSFYTAIGPTQEDLQRVLPSLYLDDDMAMHRPSVDGLVHPLVLSKQKKPRVRPFPAGEAQPMKPPPEGYRSSFDPHRGRVHVAATAARPEITSYFTGAPLPPTPTIVETPSSAGRKTNHLPPPLSLKRSSSTRAAPAIESSSPSPRSLPPNHGRAVTPWEYEEKLPPSQGKESGVRFSDNLEPPTASTDAKETSRRFNMWSHHK